MRMERSKAYSGKEQTHPFLRQAWVQVSAFLLMSNLEQVQLL